MSITVNHVRARFFLDSVALMRISRTVASLDGVQEAALMMGTPANKEIMADAGLLAVEGEAATGADLILGIRADSDEMAKAALAEAMALLAAPKGATGKGVQWRPRTLRSALEVLPEANLVLISVPGDFAAAEARKAIRRGLHAMIFSDNVSVADEKALKEEARERGVLLMGPDCGTAIIGGVPLAFANVVPRGDIGIVGASGTGTQEVSSLIAQLDGGVSHAIGVGGRDLTDAIGGITTLMALDAFDTDDETRHVVLISKPPAPKVAGRIAERIAASAKSFTVCLMGGEGFDLPDNAHPVKTLKAAAIHAMGRGAALPFDLKALARPLAKGRGGVLGLFCGGTLAVEAQVVFRNAGEAVRSNAPLPGVATRDDSSKGHLMIDLGADEFTRGRPHPMIDPTVRGDHLVKALEDPQQGLVLLDIVIGYGAHEDPAGHVARTLQATRADRPLVVASVTGTEGDLQGRAAQIAKLQAAGVLVAPSNADAAELAIACLRAGNQGDMAQ